MKQVKDFHEEIRSDTLARNVITSFHKQQLIDELQKMQIVTKK